MSDIAIRVENLSKMYRIGAREKQPQNGWQALQMLAASPFDYLRRMGRPPTEEETLWALKDVSFESLSRGCRGIKRGEVVGIPSAPLRTSIGRNGAGTHAPDSATSYRALRGVKDALSCVRCSAGESTLLKILSRITEPTKGRAAINGRVGSFLEACPEQRRRIGTGFHPELTGRENIYMNGAILGMRRGEIDRKFDEIVAFAEIEKFLDTPVKRYSSGVYVRLAFAVAAHRSIPRARLFCKRRMRE